MSPLRWPVYVPDNKIEWFREMQNYLKTRYGRTMARHLLDLLRAWELNEEAKGRKEPK